MENLSEQDSLLILLHFAPGGQGSLVIFFWQVQSLGQPITWKLLVRTNALISAYPEESLQYFVRILILYSLRVWIFVLLKSSQLLQSLETFLKFLWWTNYSSSFNRDRMPLEKNSSANGNHPSGTGNLSSWETTDGSYSAINSNSGLKKV